MADTRRWALHACRLDPDCRRADAPNRVSISTPWFYFAVALTPGSRFAGRLKEPWLSEVLAVPSGRDTELVARRRSILVDAEYERARWTDGRRR